MWRCKHCENEFDFTSRTEMGNHTRWCEKNPKRNNWNSAQASINQYGSIREYEVICENCENLFVVEEREKLFPQREKYYCSRSCANTVGGRKKAEIYHGDDVAVYSTVCFRHHEKKCVVCGEEKIVAVHHNDWVHTNNDPKNLIPLCPTHHQYVHSSYRNDVQPIIDKYIIDWNTNRGG